jgi:UDP-N-acetylmuramoylalanine--D-glutamate ligase
MREDHQGRRTLVVGLSRSGVSAVELLLDRGAAVVGTDLRARADLDPRVLELEERGLTLALGSHPTELLERTDLVVLSPGVRVDLPLVTEARRRGMPLWSELELGFREIEGTVLAVTGTKGKSTTSSLLAAMLRGSSKRPRDVRLAGNIGSPLTGELRGSSKETFFVVEVSSFQLETIVSFRPHVAVLLDVSPDHLDWHSSFEAYVAAKERIFSNQEAPDRAVVFGGNRLTVDMAERARSKKLYFDLDCLGESLPHLHQEGPWIVRHEDGVTTPLVSLEEFQLPGRHNRLNAMAASAAAALAGASGEDLEEALSQFQGLPHALEQVAVVNGVRFYNDSKATNVQAVRAALESFDGGVLLILGGRFKGGDFRQLRHLVASKVKQVFAIGESREMVQEALAGAAPVEVCDDLEAAVTKAHREAVAGDVVLLSPAGSSFDMFRDYRERGEKFREIVARLVLGG